MNEKLVQRIKDFNKTPNQDNSKRIIVGTLNLDASVTKAPNISRVAG